MLIARVGDLWETRRALGVGLFVGGGCNGNCEMRNEICIVPAATALTSRCHGWHKARLLVSLTSVNLNSELELE